MKKNREIIIIILVIISVLLIAELSIFLNDSDVQKKQDYIINQNSKMVDYHLGNDTLFDDADIEYIINAGKYSEVNTYDLTNIAMRGCNFYYNYLRTGLKKYAQLTLYYSNFLLSEGNHIDNEENILFPSHLGFKIFNFRTLRKKYEDAMGASFAVILFINTDELLINLSINNQYYLESANKVVKGILLSNKSGGGKISISDTESWFIHHNKDHRVLNGHMFTIANLIRYMNYTSDFSINDEINYGINALKNSINLYIRENKQLYNLKIFVEDIHYDRYFSPYHVAHPLLLYYLYKCTNDIELLEFYFVYMESSLHECLYKFDSNPYLIDDKFYLNFSLTSSVTNIFTSSINPYELNPTLDYFFREPIANFNLLNSINLSYSVHIIGSNEYWEKYTLTNFTNLNYINLTSNESIEIETETYCNRLKLNCIVENDKVVIKNKSFFILDLSKKLPKENNFRISIMYESIIILFVVLIIIIRKQFVK